MNTPSCAGKLSSILWVATRVADTNVIPLRAVATPNAEGELTCAILKDRTRGVPVATEHVMPIVTIRVVFLSGLLVVSYHCTERWMLSSYWTRKRTQAVLCHISPKLSGLSPTQTELRLLSTECSSGLVMDSRVDQNKAKQTIVSLIHCVRRCVNTVTGIAPIQSNHEKIIQVAKNRSP